jgi:3-methylcrotonyl-CoA carboxylase beta subunit
MSKEINLEFNKNEDYNKQLVYLLKTKHKKVALGGGEKAAAKQKEKNKMLARERVEYLIDKDSPFR